MSDYDLNDLERRMDNTIEVLKKELSGIRSGRANTNFLEPVSVNAYGQNMKLRDLSTVSAPESRLITIQVWDNANVNIVEKAIHESGLGLNPQVEGQLIRIVLPELTEERRAELAKTVSKYSEQAKISIRNVRRDIIESIRKLEKESEISEDEKRDAENRIQNITDEHVKEIDSMLSQKEIDIKKV